MCAAVCFVCASTQADLEFLAGQIARLVTQAQRLNAQAGARHTAIGHRLDHPVTQDAGVELNRELSICCNSEP